MRETLKLINKRTEINENELREERGAGIKRNVVMIISSEEITEITHL